MERKVARNVQELIEIWKTDVKFEVQDDGDGGSLPFADEYDFKNIDLNFKLNLPFHHKINSKMQGYLHATIAVLKFDNCRFLDELYIGNYEWKVKFINNCEFERTIRPESRKNSLTFDSCTIRDLNFEDVVFGDDSGKNGKVRFHSCNLFDTNFRNTQFNGLVDFWNTTFHKPVIFYKTDFYKTAVFSSAMFRENTLFTYSSITDKAIFRGTKFEKGLDLSTAIISGELNLFDLRLKYFRHSKPKNDKDYESDIFEKGNIPLKNKQETYRMLKKQYESQSNNVKALDFKFLERSAQSKATINEIKRSKYREESKRVFLYRKLKALCNQAIHFLNIISNGYGKSYFLGICFTMLVGCIFFSLSMLGTSKYVFDLFSGEVFIIDNNLSQFLNFLNPTHKFDYLGKNFNYELFGDFYFWDFTGRIFISYGIYQTIQAFRKYK